MGYSDIPDIDALARRVATRTLRGAVSYRLIAVVVVLLVVQPVLDLLERHPPWLAVSAQTLADAVFSAMAVPGYVGLRRSRRYLHNAAV